MTRWDDTGWPVLRMHTEGPQTVADVQAYLDTLLGYLDRGERFAALSTSRDTSRAEPGTAKLQMAWFTAHADALRERLVGMAAVVDAGEVDRLRTSGAKLAAHLPFPMAVFASEDQALGWVAERLADPGAPA